MTKRFALVMIAVMMMASQIAGRATFNGEHWTYRMGMTERINFIYGWMQGFSAASAMSKVDPVPTKAASQQQWLITCMLPMTTAQMERITDTFIKAHPEHWHYDLGNLIFMATIEECHAREQH